MVGFFFVVCCFCWRILEYRVWFDLIYSTFWNLLWDVLDGY